MHWCFDLCLGVGALSDSPSSRLELSDTYCSALTQFSWHPAPGSCGKEIISLREIVTSAAFGSLTIIPQGCAQSYWLVKMRARAGGLVCTGPWWWSFLCPWLLLTRHKLLEGQGCWGLDSGWTSLPWGMMDSLLYQFVTLEISWPIPWDIIIVFLVPPQLKVESSLQCISNSSHKKSNGGTRC